MKFFKKYTLKSKIENKLKSKFEDLDLENAVNLHVDAVKLTSKRDVGFFLRLYDENTVDYLIKTPKNLIALKQVNNFLPRTYIDNVKGSNLENNEILKGFEGLAKGFNNSYHKGAFAQEITGINCDYIKKFPSLAYELGSVVPMLYERLSNSNATNFLEEVENCELEVIKDVLNNPLSLIDELKTNEIHSYLEKYNKKFKEVQEDKKDEFKNKFLYGLFDLKEQILDKREVSFSNLYKEIESEMVNY